MLAAGVGARLDGVAVDANGDILPKCLLRFGGQSLLERHIRILRGLGISELVIATGFRAEAVRSEVDRIGADDFVATIHNPDFRAGSVVSMAVAGEMLASGGDVLLMDADVLYDHRLLARLIDTSHGNAFLMDKDVEPGEEPVKLCIRDGSIVDFRKRVDTEHDYHGESVGFFRFSQPIAARIVEAAQAYLASGRSGEMYEEAIRDVLLSESDGTFGFEDITGLPWIEIDFPEDVARANAEILPRLLERD